MKTRNSFLVLLLLIFCINTACKKDKENPDQLSSEFLADIGTVGFASVTNCSVQCFGLVGIDKGYTVTERGFCYSTNIDPTTKDKHIVCGQGSGEFDGTITLLLASTRYYVRAYAVNKAGTSYGSTISFVTEEPSEPEVRVYDATDITDKTAKIRVEIASTGGGIIHQQGICISENPEPTIEDTVKTSQEQNVDFFIEITDLKPNTEYYYAGFVKTDQYTAYSDSRILKTQISLMDPVKDFEGHSYRTSMINGQVWMIDNLRTKFLNDGTPIDYKTWEEWPGLTTPAYTDWYDTTGIVYNYYVINTNKICPQGWHVPNYEEWKKLLDYVDWQPRTLLEEESNTSGFSAQYFFIIHPDAIPEDGEMSYYWIFDYNYKAVAIYPWWNVSIESMGANAGVSLRCLKDETD